MKSKELSHNLDKVRRQQQEARVSFSGAAAKALGWLDFPIIAKGVIQNQLAKQFHSQLIKLQEISASLPLGYQPAITGDQLATWVPSETKGLPKRLPFGRYVEPTSETAIAAEIPFVGCHQPIIVMGNNATAEATRQVFLSMLLRTVLLLPQRARYYLIDPGNNGNTFISVGGLAHRGDTSGDLWGDLRKVQEGFYRIQNNFLNAQIPAYESLDAATQATEKLQLLFIADFPKRYDRRATEIILDIAINGPVNGTYTIIELNRDHPFPQGVTANDFNFKALTLIDIPRLITDSEIPGFQMLLDELPDAACIKGAFDRVKAMEREDVGGVRFSDIRPSDPDIWTQSSSDCIDTPIGMRGAQNTLNVWYGSRQQTVCAHGIVAGATGSGKSVFLHVLICGLASRYSPDELRLYIIDMKDGVELGCYHRLPHTAVISSNSSAELARSILTELTVELTRRYDLFKNSGTQNLTDYRNATGEKMPRILLIVDEYQGMFANDRAGQASQSLKQLAEKGRAAGIHILLASQKFEAAGMENADAIYNNFSLRMALKLESDQIDRQQMFGTVSERSLLRECDVAGKIVIKSPDSEGKCFTGRVSKIESKEREDLITFLHNLAQDREIVPEAAVVLDGLVVPDLEEAPYIRTLLETPDLWEKLDQLTEIIKSPAIGISGAWHPEDQPIACLMGKDFSVRGYASCIVKRKLGENILVVSAEHDQERYGIVGAILCSAALLRRESLILEVLDCAPPQSRWYGTLECCASELGQALGAECYFNNDRRTAAQVIDRMVARLDERKGLSDVDLSLQKSVLFVLTEPDRIDELQRIGGGLAASDSPLGKKLRRVCQEGPSVGLHTIISVGAPAYLGEVIDRRAVDLFKHRVCLQMDDKSSFDLVGSHKASQLNKLGAKPVRAYVYDQHRNADCTFKPYVASGPSSGIVASAKILAKTFTSSRV